MNCNCSDLLDMRNLQEQVKKAFCYQKLFWPFSVWINCSNDLKKLANSWPSALTFKSFSLSIEQFFLTLSPNNFGNKIPFLSFSADQLKFQICDVIWLKGVFEVELSLYRRTFVRWCYRRNLDGLTSINATINLNT